MKTLFRAFAFLLAFALLGAPMGMARMMGGHEAGAAAHQHHQEQVPEKSAPHMRFMVCAACAAVTAPVSGLPERLAQSETIAPAMFSAPHGLNAMPLLPPPRT
jgi:hypothetical protein